jgi:antirestriction protein ArdC
MSSNTESAREKQDLYDRITSQIITSIENGVGDWHMPWHTSGREPFSPINVVTRNAYRGINTLCLWTAAASKGYDRGEWGTYRQWQDLGGQVRKGEKATTVVFWKFADTAAEAQEDDEESVVGGSRLLFVKGYSVFNAAQVDGYVPKPQSAVPISDRIAGADAFFGRVGADVRHGGNRAYYSPASDYIQMPLFQAFKDNVAYYSTLAHEHTHWTGKPERCDRQLASRFHEDAYAAEELIAELGAAFVSAHLGMSTEPREDHAQYVQHWLRVLKADKRAIFTAASKAQQAADYLIERAELLVEMAELLALSA